MARPEFQPTAAQRRKVSVAAGGGMSHEEIAIALGISRNTLEKHFAAELSKVACERRMEAMEGLLKGAKKGSAAAAKAYLANSPQTAVPPLPKAAGQPKAQQLGKKEQANAAARTAQENTAWNDLLPGPPSSTELQ